MGRAIESKEAILCGNVSSTNGVLTPVALCRREVSIVAAVSRLHGDKEVTR